MAEVVVEVEEEHRRTKSMYREQGPVGFPQTVPFGYALNRTPCRDPLAAKARPTDVFASN